MYDHQLTTEQLEFRDTVRDFVVHEIRPVVLNPQRLQDLSRPLPLELIDKAARIGLRTLALTEDSGGAGADNLTSCVVMEELGAGDVNIAIPLAQTSMLGRMIFAGAMTEEQRGRFLPEFMEDDRYHLAFAAAAPDPDLGWKYHRDADARAHSGITAVRKGNGDWALEGASGFAANAPLAKLFIVQAQSPASESGAGGIVTLLVPRNAEGLTVSDSLGGRPGEGPAVKWYHGAGGELALKQCVVPADNLIAPERAALLSDPVRLRHPQFCAANIGIGRAALEAAVDYAKLRIQGGRPIIQHQAIGTILASAAVRLHLARNSVWHAAWSLDHPDAPGDYSGYELPLDTIAQAYTAEAVYKATEEAAECFGAMGVMLDMPLPKYVHDARVFLHSHDSTTMAKLRIAEALAGFVRRANP
ncbi:MAG TPA: acyl-CoA dehydrogenase family protein [Burkholderiales bacterium]|nr:acyl-CoA dehydrogenase family protein [Burkholderiales bacterium]